MTKPWSADSIPDLSGKHALVTGANSGIGLEAARELARHGARVTLACRSEERGAEAARDIARDAPSARLEVSRLDLADLRSVERFAQEVRQPVDLLLNNAGIMAIPRRTTADGFEMQLGTNHLGHFALTLRLLPHLVRAMERGAPRVVTVSSQAHRMGKLSREDLQLERRYHKWLAYGQSKLANLLFMRGLADRLEQHGLPILSVACHPGYAATQLAAVGPAMEGARVMGWLTEVGSAVVAQSAAQGALPTLYAAVAPGVAARDYIGPGGPFQMRGAPVKVRPNRAARDAEAADWLWDTSERLTGVSFVEALEGQA